jgi:hypothetical protein
VVRARLAVRVQPVERGGLRARAGRELEPVADRGLPEPVEEEQAERVLAEQVRAALVLVEPR